MATEIIPTSQEFATYEQRTALDGTDYIFSFQWNQREGRWYLDLLSENRAALVCGLKLEPNQNLLRVPVGVGLPPGWLAILDFQSLGSATPRDARAPGFEELGRRVKLVYTEAEDFEGS